jgi:hypothetical protein
MLLRDLFEADFYEPSILVIYPGRFQPFHLGHKAVYDSLVDKFGRNVYIASSGKTDPDRSPFTFDDKEAMVRAAGLPSDSIVQVKNPYRADEIITRFDPRDTVLVFAVGKKDMEDDPRFSFKPKKDGSPSYLQKWPGSGKAETMDKHGYVIAAPTVQFKVLGRSATSATAIRDAYRQADPTGRDDILSSLYGGANSDLRRMFDLRLGPPQA